MSHVDPFPGWVFIEIEKAEKEKGGMVDIKKKGFVPRGMVVAVGDLSAWPDINLSVGDYVIVPAQAIQKFEYANVIYGACHIEDVKCRLRPE